MRNSRYRRQNKRISTDVDLTPMLDIVFIMLIFFIVSAVFMDEHGVVLTSPKGGEEFGNKSARVFVFADGTASINGRKAEISTIPTRLEVLRAEVPNLSVLIESEYGAAHKHIVFLNDELQARSMTSVIKIRDKALIEG